MQEYAPPPHYAAQIPSLIAFYLSRSGLVFHHRTARSAPFVSRMDLVFFRLRRTPAEVSQTLALPPIAYSHTMGIPPSDERYANPKN